MAQYIGFKLNDEEYTIPILKVREIINTPPITKLPQSPHYVRGIINLRGNIIPIINLKELVSPESSGGAAAKVIVITNGNSAFGILVDAITSVINLDESSIEPPEGFINGHMDRIEGVARLDDRLLILLDTDKLVELEGMDMLDKDLIEIQDRERNEMVDAAPPLQAIEGSTEKDSRDAKEVFREKFAGDEQKEKFINSVIELFDAFGAHELDKAEAIMVEMMTYQDDGLFREVGRVTRKLHNSIIEFKSALDPRIKKITNEEVPVAVDNLEFVLKKTADAAENTMGMVEKYISDLPEFEKKVEKIRSPKASITYLKDFKNSLNDDLMELMLAQAYQDITGQAIRRVIDLVNTIETELVGLIATFGVKTDLAPAEGSTRPEKITQDDVEDLLKEFGF